MAKKLQITQEMLRLYSTPKGISHLIAKLRVSFRFTLLLAGRVGLPLSVENLMFTWPWSPIRADPDQLCVDNKLEMGNFTVT